MLIRILVFLVLTTLIINCKSDTNNTNSSRLKTRPGSDPYTFLIFEKEQKIEIWQEGDSIALQNSFSFEITGNLLPGLYRTLEKEEDASLFLQIKNPQFQKKYRQFGVEQLRIGTSNDPLSKIKVSNETWSALKSMKPATAIILPNDFRNSGSLDPCFACPHWMAEIYAQLELSLAPYQ